MSEDKNKQQKDDHKRSIQPPKLGKPCKTEPLTRGGIKPKTRKTPSWDNEITGEIPPWDDEEEDF